MMSLFTIISRFEEPSNYEINEGTRYTTEFKVQAEIEPKEEPWILPEKGRTTINSATMLAAIGEFQLTFDLVNLISACYAYRQLIFFCKK